MYPLPGGSNRLSANAGTRASPTASADPVAA